MQDSYFLRVFSPRSRRWLPLVALFTLLLSPLAGWGQSTTIVISQVYGGGGNNTNSPYTNDFVELFNKSAAPITLTGYTLQYAAAGNTSNFAIAVTFTSSHTIGAGKYFLVQLASGGINGSALPTPVDATGSTNIAAAAGRVALATNSTLVSGTTAAGVTQANVVDYVGYGAAAFYEGAGPTPAPNNQLAVFRAGNGCTDTNVNSADFATGTPVARNSATTAAPCSATPTITTTGTLSAFSTTTGTPSATQTYTVSGANLSGTTGITVTPPSGYEIAFGASPATYFTTAQTIAQTSTGTVAATTVNVRLTGAAAGTFTGSVANASTSATTKNVAVSGTVTTPSNTIGVPTVASGFPACITTSSGQALGNISFTSSGAGFAGSVTYTAQLSDRVGDFSSPTTIGTLTSTGAGAKVITNAAIPNSHPFGNGDDGGGYLIRIVSTSPAVTGAESTVNYQIILAPNTFAVSHATTTQTFCTTQTGTALSVTISGEMPVSSTTYTYQWQYATVPAGSYTDISTATGVNYTPNGADFGGGTADTYYVRVRATAACGGLVNTSSPATIITTPAQATAGVRQGTTDYTSGGAAYVFTSSVAVGGTGTAISFSLRNTGCVALTVTSATASSEFEIVAAPPASVAAGGSATFTVRFKPLGTGTRTGTVTIVTNDPTSPFILNLSGTGTPNASSDVILNGGFTYNTTGINYAALQGTTITNNASANSEAVFSVRVRDGGGVDADALPTVVESIQFRVLTGIGFIRSAALFKGNALVSNSPTISATSITFSGLAAGGIATANDDGNANLTLHVTFLATVTDAFQLSFNLTSANITAAATGSSTFASFTTVVSPTTAGTNEINVIADRLRFNPTPPSPASVNVDLTVGVEAVDVNLNRDTDFRLLATPSVTLTRGTGTGTFTSASNPTLTKTLTSGVANWTDLRYDVIETAQLTTTNTGGLTNVTTPITFVAFAGILWDGGAGTTSWFDANNWSGNVVPTATDDVRLDNTTISGSYTVNVAAVGAVARSLRVGTPSGTSTITLNLTGVVSSTSADVLTLGGSTQTALSIVKGGVVVNSTTGSSGVGIKFTANTDTWTMSDDAYFKQNTATAFPDVTLNKSIFASTTTFEVPSVAATNWANSAVSRIKKYGNLITVNTTTVTLATGLNTTDSLVISGNWTHSGGLVRFVDGVTDGIRVRVKGDLAVGTSGIVRVAEGSGGGGSGTELIVEGGVTTSGTGYVAGTGSGAAAGRVTVGGSFTGAYNAGAATDILVFSPVGGNTAVSTFTLSGTVSVRTLTLNKSVKLGSNVAPTIITTVADKATLDFNGFNTTGAGQFTLVAGGTLKITDPAGITQAAATATGNVRGTGARSFPNGNGLSSGLPTTYWYTGATPQRSGTGLPTTNGIKNIILDNPTRLRLTASTSIQTTGRLEIKQGILIDSTGYEVSGTGNLTMSGGTYRLWNGVVSGNPTTVLPQLSGAYALTGGAVELAGAGNQSLRGGVTYNKLRFKNAGTKTLTSAVSNLPDSLVIGGTALLDLTVNSAGTVGSVGLSGPGGLRMSGTSRLRTTRTTATGPAPGMEGEYTLTGGTVEFANTNVTQQTIRGNEVSDPNRTYYNIEVTGTNVGASLGNFAIGAGGTMSVKPGGAFVMTDQVISGAGAFVTEAGSTFGYGSPQGIVASGATGNIQTTGGRTFDPAASYILRGTAAMITGSGLPASVLNLTVSLGTAGLVATLTNATTVTGGFTFTQGLLGLVNQDLTLAATATLTGASATSYFRTANNPTATGELVRPVANTSTDVLFPIGTSTYTPVRLRQVASATTDDFSVRVFDGTLTNGTGGTPLTNDVVNRTWMVAEATAGGSNATLTVQWNAADETVSFDRSLCTVVHYDGTAWTNQVRDYAPATTVSAGVYVRARGGLTSFSPFAVQDYDQPLPVELTRFAAAVTPKRTVALTWATASEKNAARFEVQRSGDGRAYQTIGTVEAHGTTTQVQVYDFEDEQPLGGTSYYRLRQVDLDGAAQFSSEVAVTVDAAVVTAGLEVYPTKFATDLHLLLVAPAAGEATVIVTDLSGRRVLTQALTVEVGSASVTVPTTRLVPGIYLVQVVLPGGEVLRQRAVKE